jgi:mannose-1-phosphate guanylyltransferase/phosphomannomutase
VIWDDTFIGKQSTVSGAVLCRRVDVRARAVIDVGVTIGDESVVGAGAHIGADVQVFPYKRIEPAATVNSSVIWESTATRSLFSDGAISGLVGIDVTSERMLRVAEAFGSLLPKGGHVVVTRDTSRPARMIKRAMVSGLNAAGINVRDLRVTSPALNRFTTQKTRCEGGIHVAVDQSEPQALEIRFFDANGLDIAPSMQKKIERLFFRQEFRRAFFDEVGEIIYPARPMEYYTASLNEAVRDAGLSDSWRKIVADMGNGAASLVLPRVAHAWHINTIQLNSLVDTELGGSLGDPLENRRDLGRAIELFAADLGVTFDAGAERVRFMTNSGREVDGDNALHAVVDLWCRTRPDTEGTIAVSLVASQAVDGIAARYGRTVVRPGRSRRALAQAVLDGRAVFAGSTTGGFIFGDFFPAFDGVLTVGMVVRMLAKADLTFDELLVGLPPCYKAEASVFCPIDRKGAVMRQVTDQVAGETVDLTEGVRVLYDDGWALVLPDATQPTVNVWAEAEGHEAAQSRLEHWRKLVEDAIAED